MKKVMLLAKSFVVLSLLFCSIGVFAEIPKTINVQGKITNDSGAPITNTNATVELLVSENNFTSGTPYTFTSNGSTPVDSEGLYNVDININNPNVDFSKQYYFKVKVTVAGNTIESEKKPFASNPYAFYASEATSAGSITVPGDEDGLVWATKKEGNKFIQEWIKPTTLEISPANSEKIGGIKLGEKTGLSKDISEDGILRVLPATKETIGGVIVATNYGLDIGEDGTLNISPASTGGFGVVKLGTKKGLGLESNALVVSVDGTTIGINTQNGQLKVVDNVFQPKLTVGDGINIDTTDGNKISAKIETKKGLSLGTNGLSVYVDGSTMGINDDGKLNVIQLPSYTQQGGDGATNKVWGYKNATTQDWISMGSLNFVAEDGLDLTNGKLKVLVGSGLEIDTVSNEIYVSTGTGLEIGADNKISVSTAAANKLGGFKLTSANDSGLEMGEGAILKVNVGTGLTIDNNDNAVKVTVAPAAQKINNPDARIGANASGDDGKYYYVWGAAANNDTDHTLNESTQGWIRMRINRLANTNYFHGADLAEIYQSTEKLVPGDVVSIDPAKDNAIVKTKVAEDTMVAGVISTEPGVLMNQDEKGYKLALVGKVPTKVCNEGGAIKRGDLLVSASIPGYAKKAGDNPKVGTVIGKALENSDSQKGTILVLVNLQ